MTEVKRANPINTVGTLSYFVTCQYFLTSRLILCPYDDISIERKEWDIKLKMTI